MQIRSLRSLSGAFLLMLLCLIITPAFAQPGPSSGYEQAMALFENTKKTSDWAAGEKYVRAALQYQFTDYAGGSLVWVIGREGRYEEALSLAQMLLGRTGPTTSTMGTYIEVALNAGEFDLAERLLIQAEQLGLQHGDDWTHTNIVHDRERLDNERRSSFYELKWIVPNKDFPKGGRRRFAFPALDYPGQKFTFRLAGAQRYTIIAGPDETMVDIWPQSGSDVTVLGEATIFPQILGIRTFDRLAQIPLTPAPASKTGALYYYDERIDPAYGPCRDLAKTLIRPSAVETVQAILNWRDAHITYGAPPKGNTLETILTSHQGVCHHSAYLTVCLARAAGIPAYVVGGLSLPDKLGTFEDWDGSHGWGEVELPSVGRVDYESQDHSTLVNFSSRKTHLTFGRNICTRPFRSYPNLSDYVSLQSYRVSGRRVQ